MMMHMCFYSTAEFTLIFKQFASEDSEYGKFAILLVVVFFMGIMLEAINYQRGLMVKQLTDEISLVSKLMISFSYFLSVTLAYALMLCVMSFNTRVFIIVVLSITLGNSLFSYIKKRNITVGSLTGDKTEDEAVSCCAPLIEDG